ncbi:MAG: hypothetical protein IJ710_06090 [Prevotella sp.]|nr:hypothetical protein [Prevotella sp.]
MADNTQTYTTRVFLNDQEAKKELDELIKKTEDLRKKKEDAANAGEWKGGEVSRRTGLPTAAPSCPLWRYVSPLWQEQESVFL